MTIADDLVNGLCCSECGVFFFDENEKPVEHGYPVLCWDCHSDGSEIPRAEVGDD